MTSSLVIAQLTKIIAQPTRSIAQPTRSIAQPTRSIAQPTQALHNLLEASHNLLKALHNLLKALHNLLEALHTLQKHSNLSWSLGVMFVSAVHLSLPEALTYSPLHFTPERVHSPLMEMDSLWASILAT